MLAFSGDVLGGVTAVGQALVGLCVTVMIATVIAALLTERRVH